MHRGNLVTGLVILVCCSVLATAVSGQQVQGQIQGQAQEQIQVSDATTSRSMATLTTTDLIGASDITTKPSPGPATRSRIVQTTSNSKAPEAEVPAGQVSSTGDLKLDALVSGAAERNGVDRRLIMAVMKQESSFNPRAVSYKGARGLMQLMPATAYRFGVRDLFDPAQNIEGGARYLKFLLDTFNGNVELALAGYNAGENAVIRFGSKVPPYRETQDYVRKISAHYDRLSNGAIVRREIAPAPRKPVDTGFVTAGQTMTQF